MNRLTFVTFKKCIVAVRKLCPITRRYFNQHYPIDGNIFGLTEKQKKLRNVVFDIVQTDNENGQNKTYNQKAIFKKLGKLSLMGVTVKKEYGGWGGCYLDQVIVQEELTRACGTTALMYNTHSNLCISAINSFGTEEQKRKFLPKLCSGEHTGHMTTLWDSLKVDKQADHYIFNSNQFMNNCYADIFILFAKINPHEIATIIVEKNYENQLTLKVYDFCRMAFQDCKIPVANVLGKNERVKQIFDNNAMLERLMLAGGPVGLMQACWDVTFRYLHTKDKFSEFKDQTSDMYTRLCASRSYLYTIARAYDNGYSNSKDCAAVYLHGIKNAEKVVHDAYKILGKIGYTENNPIERLLRVVKFYDRVLVTVYYKYRTLAMRFQRNFTIYKLFDIRYI